MKKLALVVLLLLVSVVTFYAINPSRDSSPPANDTTTSGSPAGQGEHGGQSEGGTTSSSGMPEDAGITVEEGEAPIESEQPDRPATELYRNAEEALKAVREGAGKYDDVVLEQFTLLGPHCTWCDEFYKSVREMATSTDVPTDQRSYFAELLAISGRVENVQTLVNAIENPGAPENAELYSEALEMTVGSDDVVKFLSGKLPAANPTLKESLVAAIANQSSSLAVDSLYRFTVESGNPDGFYSQGTGLGEMIPDEEAYPLLKDIVQKRDDFSHLGAKALLNAGTEGMQILFDSLEQSPDPDRDQKILKDAEDHVNYDDGTKAELEARRNSMKNPAIQDFIRRTMATFEANDSDAPEEPAEDSPPADAES